MLGRETRPRGFTLMELTVVLLIAALLVGVSIPALRSVTATQLKRAAGEISGMAREAYARAAISGKPQRLVLDLDEGAYWVEEGSGTFALQLEKARQLTEQEIQQRKAGTEVPAGGSARRDSDSEEEKLKEKLLAGPTWTEVEGDLGRHQKLPNDTAFEKVWVAHQSEAFQRGQSHLYFWPTGRTETAVIRLTDDPEGHTRIISVKINGLTGRSMVADRALEIPSS
ncbi:MAG: prepilin-type N-terminal cleavage/methylation domain-containing protein [Deltaproteobacteria bacterium]|nr:prepilin-type N-terminal cleavage/methylation domain-containing protein [Deltaproteobacteria bacterium]